MLNDKFVANGNYPFPIQINQGVMFARDNMTITHEEADTLIIQQMAYVGAANILIVADDTYMKFCSYVSLCKTMTSLGL